MTKLSLNHNRLFARALMLFIFISACLAGNPPAWISQVPEEADHLVVVAQGEYKLDALAKGLYQLTQLHESKREALAKNTADNEVYTEATASRSNANLSLGNIEITSVKKSYVEASESSAKGLQFHQDVCKIVLTKGEATYELRYLLETSHEGQDQHQSNTVAASGENLRLADLLHELEQAGVAMQTYATDSNFYFKLSYPLDP